MSIAEDTLARIVAGVLADPGSSSKDSKKVVAKALEVYDEMKAAIAKRHEDDAKAFAARAAEEKAERDAKAKAEADEKAAKAKAAK